MIAASLREFGFINPILIDRDNQIVAGQGRWEAAKIEGYQQVPTIRLEHLTEKQRRAYVIADNRLAEQAGWDRELLVLELGALVELECDLESVGFEPGEIHILNSDLGAEKRKPADKLGPTRGPAVTRLGDLWRLGGHRILCGDFRRDSDFPRLMSGTIAAMVFAEPSDSARAAGGRPGDARVEPTERDVAYYLDVAIRRWQADSKSDAVLEGDGRTFDEIAAERMKTDLVVPCVPGCRRGARHREPLK